MVMSTAVLLSYRARHIWKSKDAAETAKRSVDWTARLAKDDAIVSSTFELPAGLIAKKATNTDTVTTILLSGGCAGVAYEVVNRVMTRDGAEIDQAIRVRVNMR
jgi:hypothetical protein